MQVLTRPRARSLRPRGWRQQGGGPPAAPHHGRLDPVRNLPRHRQQRPAHKRATAAVAAVAAVVAAVGVGAAGGRGGDGAR